LTVISGPGVGYVDAVAIVGTLRPIRYPGLTVRVQSAGVVEYWWKDGWKNADLVLKTVGSTAELLPTSTSRP
jgi:hypothetical protein